MAVEAPLVTLVTPFFNTAAWLTECIESVLAQTYHNWEYILVDNCSTDGSTEIARRYAKTDSRIRYVRHPKLLSQVSNYNAALSLISADSRYCKIVQADDWIFPSCISAMVGVFESSEAIGLVSSYYLKGSLVYGQGLPYPSPIVSGTKVVRRLIRAELWVFGSPTAVMYRSSIVRATQPFYDESCLHEDTEACVRLLRDWDLGFVHQVLSFLRTGNESITARVKDFVPDMLDAYIISRRYAPMFFSAMESRSIRRDVKVRYYRFLARSVLRARERDFWRYQSRGLATISEPVDWPFLALSVAKELVWLAINPGLAAATAFRRKKRGERSAVGSDRGWLQL